ncbi:MAG TPA: hypothetical protein DHN33_09410 [Eubacteriaceae bacterium]|nr:hypothetical protein [Eubacteriaceae bacterium]
MMNGEGGCGLNEVFLKDIRQAIDHQLEEMNTQVELSLEDISCPVRQELGDNIDLMYMRIIRLALRETYGSKLSDSILYQAGKNIAISAFDIKDINDLVGKMNQLMLGKTRIVQAQADLIIFEEDECAVCSGVPELGEALCSFESGFIAGSLIKITKRDVVVQETKCWGLGDRVCRFEATVYPKGTINEKEKVNTVDMIAALASKASVAIELNKELQYKNDIFSKQLEFAQNIQKSIIPSTGSQQINGIDLFSYLKPFRKVGGDFYDLFPLSDQKLGVSIADMAGDGIDAAMITSMLKLILTHCKKSDSVLESPKTVMEYVEEDVNEVIPNNYFSMIYLVLDAGERTITYTNAGHPTPILYRKKQNSFQMLKANMPLVGLNQYMLDPKFKQNTVQYEPGDQLFLYTDGIPETRNIKGEFYNIDRMLDSIKASKEKGIDRICEKLIQHLNAYRGSLSQDDDLCLIGLQL